MFNFLIIFFFLLGGAAVSGDGGSFSRTDGVIFLLIACGLLLARLRPVIRQALAEGDAKIEARRARLAAAVQDEDEPEAVTVSESVRRLALGWPMIEPEKAPSASSAVPDDTRRIEKEYAAAIAERDRLARRLVYYENRKEAEDELGTDPESKGYRRMMLYKRQTERMLADAESALDEFTCRSWAV